MADLSSNFCGDWHPHPEHGHVPGAAVRMWCPGTGMSGGTPAGWTVTVVFPTPADDGVHTQLVRSFPRTLSVHRDEGGTRLQVQVLREQEVAEVVTDALAYLRQFEEVLGEGYTLTAEVAHTVTDVRDLARAA